MFKPVTLKKFRLIVLRDRIQETLETLQALKVLELAQTRLPDTYAEISGYPASERGKFAALQLARLKQVQGFLENYAPKVSKRAAFTQLVFPKKRETGEMPRDFRELENIVHDEIVPLNLAVGKLEDTLAFLSERQAELLEKKMVIQSLAHTGIRIELLRGYESVAIIAGTAPRECAEAVRKAIAAAPEAELIQESGTENKTVFVALVPGEHEQAWAKQFAQVGLERMNVPAETGTGKQVLARIAEEEQQLKAEKQAIVEQARELRARNTERVAFLLEVFEAEKYTAQAFSLFRKTEDTTIMEFFTPAQKAEKLAAHVSACTHGEYYLEEMPFTEDEAPVLLDNWPGVRNYEYVIEMFGMTRYGRFDPTIIVALFYPIFFGITFGDVVYGGMLTLLALFLRQTMWKEDVNNRRLATVLLHGGIMTMFFGFLFGSALGDAFNPGGILAEPFKAVFGGYLQPLWFNPLSQEGSVGFLLLALAIGVIQINLGVIIGLVESVKRREIEKALFGSMVWFILEAGVILLALNQAAHSAAEFQYAGGVLLLLAIVMLIKANGPLGILGLTGFSGNILSYTRLLALGLATGAIALAINILVSLLAGIPYVGWLLATLLFIVGHLANYAFNALGSFIHSLRLHFVEFFGYFFEGGGKKFEPFHFSRKLTTTGGMHHG